MSGTASRFQTRFGYAPGLRTSTYSGGQVPASAAPQGGVAPSIPFTPTPSYQPSPLAQLAAPSSAPSSAPPVMAGSMTPDRRNELDGAGDSAQGDYGGPGPSGMASTGDFMSDAMGFGLAAGRAGLGIMGPTGPIGSALGVMGAAITNELGFPETAQDIAATLGLQGPITGYTQGQQNPAAYGEQSPGSTEGGLKSDTATAAETLSVDYGMDGAGMGGDNSDNANSNSTAAGQDAAGGQESGYGGGAGGLGDQAGYGDSGQGDWMRGGYTGGGQDGAVQPQKIAGRVHEGEVVIPAAQVARYGLAPLMMLARGSAEPSRLAALLRG